MDTTDPNALHADTGAELNQLTQLLLSTDSFESFLNELVAYASAHSEHSCSITVRLDKGIPYTVASTDDLTLRLDERQYAGERGPCLEALDNRIPVFVTDMTTETRWTPYPQLAAELGVQSAMAYPLINADKSIGALNFYALRQLAPDASLQARAAQLADRAAGALAVGLRMAEQSAEAENLRAALTSRSVIDQAIGILMAQQRCSSEAGFDLLRRASQSRNIKLRDVAAQIVAGVERGTTEGPPRR
jgi:transcriptional regulator with GAF, ATPase, and Fis domain